MFLTCFSPQFFFEVLVLCTIYSCCPDDNSLYSRRSNSASEQAVVTRRIKFVSAGIFQFCTKTITQSKCPWFHVPNMVLRWTDKSRKNGTSSSSSEEEEDSSPRGEQDDGIQQYDESFTSSQRTIVSTLTPSLLLLRNPFPYFICITVLTLLVAAASIFGFSTACDHIAPDFPVVPLRRYRTVLYRGSRAKKFST